MQAPVGDLLVGLMPFPGDKHDVPGFRSQDGLFYGKRAVGFHIVRGPEALADLRDDRERVFAARVVRGDEHAVGEA